MAFTVEAPRPDNVEPIDVELSGFYQSDPGDLDDWRDRQWSETISFVRMAPFDEVSRVIRSVAQDGNGNLIIAGGIDLSRFLVANCADDESARRMRTVISDKHRALDQKTIGKVVFHLIGEWGGRPMTPSPG